MHALISSPDRRSEVGVCKKCRDKDFELQEK